MKYSLTRLSEQKRKAKWGKILKKAKQDLAWHAPTPWVPYIPKDVRKVRRFLRKWPVEWKEYVGMSVGGALLPPKPASRARRGETIAEDAEGEEEAEREWEEQQERVKLWARRQKEEEEREEREADEREKKGKKPVPIWAMKAKGVRRQEKTAAETVREIPAPNSGLPPVAGVQGLPAAYNAIWQ